jgi:hypothetical protein
MFQPTDVSGCLIWLKADDISANSSNYVVSWANSGYQSCSFSAQSEDLLSRNVLQPASLNNHATLRINGAGGGLIADGVTGIPTTSKITAIYLFKQNLPAEGANIQTIFSGPNNLNDDLPQTAYVFSSSLQLSNNWLFYYYSAFWSPNSAQQITSSGYLSDWIIRSDVVDDNIVMFKRNGIAVESGVLATPLPDVNSMGPIVADAFNVGCLGSNFPLNSGEIAEIIVYDHRITDQELTNVESYLKYKYFVAGTFGCPTFIHGCSTGTSGQYSLAPLYIESSPASGNLPLFIAQAYTISSGTPLYTAGIPVKSDSINLYTGAPNEFASSGTLYTLGDTPSNSGISLYTQSAQSLNSNVFLYTSAAPSSSGETSLVIYGRFLANSDPFPFYIQGLQNLSANNNTALFIANLASPANPNGSGVYSNHSLYINAASEGVQLPLFIQSDTQGSNNAGMPLYIENHPSNLASGVNMFIQNSNIAFSGQAKMFIKGLGDLDGGLIGHDNMNLYIERWPTGQTTLFINSSTAPSSTSLYIAAANSINSNFTLTMSGGQQLVGTGIFPMYVDAGFVKNDNITVYTHGLPSSNNNSTFYTNGF